MGSHKSPRIDCTIRVIDKETDAYAFWLKSQMEVLLRLVSENKKAAR